MGILGVGVDVLHLPRLVSLIQRRSPLALARRILSRRELVAWTSLPSEQRQTQYLATRWAVKEAAYKACSPVVTPTWKEMSLVRDGPSGKPEILYHPGNINHAKLLGNIHVSLSHDGEYVFASVLVETAENRV